MTTEATAPAATEKTPVVARAGKYFRITRYIMTGVLLIYGAWSIYDGFISWPEWPISHPNEKPKSDMDIKFNQVLGMVLPPLAIVLLIRALYISRGKYRLEDGILYVPGHPPVPLDTIHKIDRELWDRKGIAWAEYTVDGKDGEIKLDDFVYDREPMDQIFKATEAAVLKAGEKREVEEARPAQVAPVVAAARPVAQRPVAAVTPAKPTVATPPRPAAAPRPVAAAPAKPPVSAPVKPQAAAPSRPAAAAPPKPVVAARPVTNPVKPQTPLRPASVNPAAPPAAAPQVKPVAKPPANPAAPKAPAKPVVKQPTQLPPRPRLDQ
jgi:hypothetical protein